MTAQTNKSKNSWVLIPVFGCLLFIVIYIIAALLYPGGSETDKAAVGFSFKNNYWCNLLHDNAINGQRNPAKPFALAGMFILCLSLSIFWIVFPEQIPAGKFLRLPIQITGTGAMLSSFLLLTNIDHDLAVNFASSLGFIAIIGTLICLYKTRWYGLFAFGVFNILLVGLNNYLYNTKEMMIYLPVVQKISFLSFLVWICLINLNIYRRSVKIFPKAH